MADKHYHALLGVLLLLLVSCIAILILQSERIDNLMEENENLRYVNDIQTTMINQYNLPDNE